MKSSFKNRYSTTFQRKEQTVTNGWRHQYYADGSMKSSGRFIENEMDGEWKLYYKGGLIRAIRTYNKGIKQGLWERYDDAGKLIERVYYENGTKLK